MYIFHEAYIPVQGDERITGLRLNRHDDQIPEKIWDSVSSSLSEMQKDGWEVLSITRNYVASEMRLFGFYVILRKPCE